MNTALNFNVESIESYPYVKSSKVMSFAQLDSIISHMLFEKKLTRETNGFFRLSKSKRNISLDGASKIAFNWAEITREFLYTVISGIGLFSESLRLKVSPELDLVSVLQKVMSVISDDLSNAVTELQNYAPQGAEGAHYIWWENSIAKPIYAAAKIKNVKIVNTPSTNVKKLLDCMLKLSKNKFGAAIQLRIVEAIAQEIALSYRALFTELSIDGALLFPTEPDLAWINSHIKAEVIHHRLVKDTDGGMSQIARTFEEQQEYLDLTAEYIEAWEGAMHDFRDFVLDKDLIENKKIVSKNNRKWICVVCDFIYDEETGLVEDGILPGTSFDDIPNDWVCTDCGVSKSDFKLVD